MTDITEILNGLDSAGSRELAGCENWTLQDCVDRLGRIQLLKSRVRQFEQLLTEALIEWIQVHGPIEIGSVKYYAGDRTRETCLDVLGVLQELFESHALEDLPGCLRSDPFKLSACRQMLGDEVMDKFFKKVRTKTLAKGKALKRVDTKWLK